MFNVSAVWWAIAPWVLPTHAEALSPGEPYAGWTQPKSGLQCCASAATLPERVDCICDVLQCEDLTHLIGDVKWV